MSDIQLKLNGQGEGAFVVEEKGVRQAEMVVRISDSNLTVFHTEVAEALKGKGVAGQLLEKMAAYAREHNLKVIPLCPYVNSQFTRHPEKYNDVWNKHWHDKK